MTASTALSIIDPLRLLMWPLFSEKSGKVKNYEVIFFSNESFFTTDIVCLIIWTVYTFDWY